VIDLAAARARALAAFKARAKGEVRDDAVAAGCDLRGLEDAWS
jgi:hypothetical protein